MCVFFREEKTEQLMDSKHEVERLDQESQRLKQEVRISLYGFCLTLEIHYTVFVWMLHRV